MLEAFWQSAERSLGSTFAVFVLTQDKPLTTDIVFPALTLFNLWAPTYYSTETSH
jgi:hypothetical protein